MSGVQAAPLRMLDLFCGRGGASQAMRARGWHVTGVDTEARFAPNVCADVATFTTTERFDLVWASPPCTEFARESMPWCRTGRTPSLELVQAAVRVVHEVKPRWWAIENVRGSLKHLIPVLGPWRHHVGSLFLWGELPPGLTFPETAGHKMRHAGQRPDLRSMVPAGVSLAIALAVEEASGRTSTPQACPQCHAPRIGRTCLVEYFCEHPQ